MVEVGDDEGRVTLAVEPEVREAVEKFLGLVESIEGHLDSIDDYLSDLVDEEGRVADAVEKALSVAAEEAKDGAE